MSESRRELTEEERPVLAVEEVKARQIFGGHVVWLDGEWQIVKAGGTQEGRTELLDERGEMVFDGPSDELVLRRVVPVSSEPCVAGLVGALLGCQWGSDIAHPDDLLPCSERAVQIVVLHDGPRKMAFKLCARHRDLALAESTAREGDSDAA